MHVPYVSPYSSSACMRGRQPFFARSMFSCPVRHPLYQQLSVQLVASAQSSRQDAIQAASIAFVRPRECFTAQCQVIILVLASCCNATSRSKIAYKPAICHVHTPLRRPKQESWAAVMDSHPKSHRKCTAREKRKTSEKTRQERYPTPARLFPSSCPSPPCCGSLASIKSYG